MPKIVDHEARRAEITEVAIDLIASGGLEAATIREIASRSGHSKGVVEHYFENKEELITAALEGVNAQYTRRAEAASVSLRGIAAIRACLMITVPLTPQLRREWKVRLVFWAMAAIDEELKRQQGERLRRAVDLFAGHLREAIDDGDIQVKGSPQEVGRRLVNMVTGLSVAALHNESFGRRMALEAEVDSIIRCLTLPPGR